MPAAPPAAPAPAQAQAQNKPPPAAPVKNPLEIYIQKAGAYLASTQGMDGSWPHFQSPTPDFAVTKRHANLFGTMIALMNLTNTPFEASAFFEKGSKFLINRMLADNVWSFYQPGEMRADSWVEPDASDTALALILVGARLSLTRDDVAKVKEIMDSHRTEEGLYLNYFDGLVPEKGFALDPQEPSLGVNLHVLAFLGKYQLGTGELLKALRDLMQKERYWESSGFYRSLPVLAYLASNAVEHGAPEAGELMRQLLADFEAGDGAAPDFAKALHTLELAAYVKSKAHHCLLELNACRNIDLVVMELAGRRMQDGSWGVAPFYDYAANPTALAKYLDRKDFMIPRKRGGFDYDVERALSSPGTVHYYDGSSAETTSFGLKAIAFYRELLKRRPSF